MSKLKEARILISDKSKWTQRYAARNQEGQECDLRDAKAVRFCALGALHVVTNGGPITVQYALLVCAAKELFDIGNVSDVNDSMGHEAVLKMYDRAIEVEDEQTKGS